MNILEVIEQHQEAVQLLFDIYGIDLDVTPENLSNAIVLNSSPDGNVFIDDLEDLIIESQQNQEDFLSFIFGTKAIRAARKVKRQKRRATRASERDARQTAKASAIAQSKGKRPGNGGKIWDVVSDLFGIGKELLSGRNQDVRNNDFDPNNDERSDEPTNEPEKSFFERNIVWILGGALVFGVIIYAISLSLNKDKK